MNLDPAPRLNKTVFIAIDLVLLSVAAGIAFLVEDPYAPLPFVTAVSCVVLAAVLVLVPFLVDYAAEHADAAQRERERVSEQVARLQSAAEGLSRVLAQIKAVEEAVQKSAREAETLPYRMQEKVAELSETLEARDSSERDALEQEIKDLRKTGAAHLAEAADKALEAAAELKSVDKALGVRAADATAVIERLQAAATEASSKLADAIAKTASADSPKAETATTTVGAGAQGSADPRPPAQPPAGSDAASPAARTSATASGLPDAVPETPKPAHGSKPPVAVAEPPGNETEKPKKPRAARKSKPEDTPAEMPADEPAAETASSGDSPDGGDTGDSAKEESSSSSDGATRLLATAYIGIGNRLFIRGDGPGLSWERGEPMQFVSIGKWGWHTHEASGPVRCKLYKNDESAALSGEILLEPGRHTEVTALF